VHIGTRLAVLNPRLQNTQADVFVAVELDRKKERRGAPARQMDQRGTTKQVEKFGRTRLQQASGKLFDNPQHRSVRSSGRQLAATFQRPGAPFTDRQIESCDSILPDGSRCGQAVMPAAGDSFSASPGIAQCLFQGLAWRMP
jgi:hypothetical protein